MSSPRIQGTSKRFATGGLSTKDAHVCSLHHIQLPLVFAVKVVPSEAIVLPRVHADETCLRSSSTKHQCKPASAVPMPSSHWTK